MAYRPFDLHQQVEYNKTGQTLEFYPPVEQLILNGAPPSAASVSCWEGTDSNDNTAEWTATATLDSVSTTLNAAAGPAQATARQTLTLLSSTGATVGRRYLLSGADGHREMVIPTAVDASTKIVTLSAPLVFDYATGTGSTFKGIRQSVVVPASFVQSLENLTATGSDLANAVMGAPWRVSWVIGAQTYWTTFDLVRSLPIHGVTVEDLAEDFPDLKDNEWRSQRGEKFTRQIEAAWESLKFRLRMKGYGINQILDGPVLHELIKTGALARIGAAGLTPKGRDKESWIREWRVANEQAEALAFSSGGIKTWIDCGTAGAITPEPARKLRLGK